MDGVCSFLTVSQRWQHAGEAYFPQLMFLVGAFSSCIVATAGCFYLRSLVEYMTSEPGGPRVRPASHLIVLFFLARFAHEYVTVYCECSITGGHSE